MSELRHQLIELLGIEYPATVALPDTLPYATFLTPDGLGPHPAILYCHAHGGQYELGRRELTQGARWLANAPAAALLDAGFAVLCIDMPGFGERQFEGTESALAKAGFWRGRPLFGQMVADQLAAFNWLAQRPEIDSNRIATLGTSMGAALALWTSAIEPRVAASVQLCMLANIAPMIDDGAFDRHGFYLTVPGLLGVADMGDIAGLIAPRPLFLGYGELDHLTPISARDQALEQIQPIYAESETLKLFIAPASGHLETSQMRKAVLAFLTDVLIH